MVTNCFGAMIKKYSIRFTISLLCLFGLCSQANAWSTKDTLWEGAYLAAHVADWGQTRDIASSCASGAYYETNPVMGKCPSINLVNTYFAATALLHIGVAHVLPQKYRRMFQAGTLGMEVNYVANNARIGLSVNF